MTIRQVRIVEMIQQEFPWMRVFSREVGSWQPSARIFPLLMAHRSAQQLQLRVRNHRELIAIMNHSWQDAQGGRISPQRPW